MKTPKTMPKSQSRRRVAPIFFALIALVALAVAPGRAEAQSRECVKQCKDSAKLCGASIKNGFKACKTDCRYMDDRDAKKACKLTCKEEFSTSKNTCKGEIETCSTVCTESEPTPGGDGGGGGGDGENEEGSCEDTCQEGFRDCLKDGLPYAKQCARDCTTTHRDAIKECREQPFSFLCFLEASGELVQCLHSCANAIREWPQACKADRDTCIDGCNGGGTGPGPYGSASQAFLQANSCLLD